MVIVFQCACSRQPSEGSSWHGRALPGNQLGKQMPLTLGASHRLACARLDTNLPYLSIGTAPCMNKILSSGTSLQSTRCRVTMMPDCNLSTVNSTRSLEASLNAIVMPCTIWWCTAEFYVPMSRSLHSVWEPDGKRFPLCMIQCGLHVSQVNSDRAPLISAHNNFFA